VQAPGNSSTIGEHRIEAGHGGPICPLCPPSPASWEGGYETFLVPFGRPEFGFNENAAGENHGQSIALAETRGSQKGKAAPEGGALDFNSKPWDGLSGFSGRAINGWLFFSLPGDVKGHEKGRGGWGDARRKPEDPSLPSCGGRVRAGGTHRGRGKLVVGYAVKKVEALPGGLKHGRLLRPDPMNFKVSRPMQKGTKSQNWRLQN